MVLRLMSNIFASFSSRGRIPGGGGQGVGFPKSSPVEQADEDFDEPSAYGWEARR
jgi:hypothetical protein